MLIPRSILLFPTVLIIACTFGYPQDTVLTTSDTGSTSDPTTTTSGSTTTSSGTVTSASSTTTSSTSDATTFGTSTTSSTTTTGSDPCGNGQPDAGEQCDDGENNGKYGYCNEKCSGPGPHCGDGFVHAGTEECDDGDADNTNNCLDTCKKASCGDGFVHAGTEECEHDANNPNGCADTGCKYERRLVFVTKAAYAPGTDFKSISDATALCNTAAATISPDLSGKFSAWLGTQIGDKQSSPASDWGMTDFKGWFVLPNETLVAEGWSGLTSGSLINAISIHEDKSSAGNVSVWTGLDKGGTTDMANDCQDWTGAQNPSGTVGLANAKDSTWTFSESVSTCGDAKRLYCFQTSP